MPGQWRHLWLWWIKGPPPPSILRYSKLFKINTYIVGITIIELLLPVDALKFWNLKNSFRNFFVCLSRDFRHLFFVIWVSNSPKIVDHKVLKFWLRKFKFVYLKSFHPWYMCPPVKEFYLIVPLRVARDHQSFPFWLCGVHDTAQAVSCPLHQKIIFFTRT